MKKVLSIAALVQMTFCCYSQIQPSFYLLAPEIEWQTTDLSVTSTDTLNIFASGYITNLVSEQSSIPLNRIYTPAGLGRNAINPDETLLCEDCPVYSLIGKIGEDGDPFYMGVNSLLVPSIDGELYVAINDGSGNFNDNTGCWVITIYNGGIEGNGLVGTDDPTELTKTHKFMMSPNPVSNTSKIEFELYEAQFVKFELFTMDGKQVTSVKNEFYGAGMNEFHFNFENISAGNYLISMILENGKKSSKKIIIN
jgi:hypothetical protein